jgi:ankyrin repeat protein
MGGMARRPAATRAPSKTALFDAAKRWDADAVRRMLASSPELIRSRDPRGRTALHLCAATPVPPKDADARPSIATARALLGAGADLNEVHEIPDDKEIFRASPLWYALARGRNHALARFFVKEGADPQGCLWTVVFTNEPAMVRLLLQAGSPTNVWFDGETPLHYAARLGREEPLLALIAAGANTSVKDANGRTAMDHARKKRLSPSVLAALSAR